MCVQTPEQWKRVIKHRSTGEYYAGDGLWTDNFEDAEVFENLALAFDIAQQDGLTDCCILIFRLGRQTFDAQFLI